MTFKMIKDKLKLDNNYSIYDISNELWREYTVNGQVYTIQYPVALIIRKKGRTHRIVDDNGITHCVLAPEYGSFLRWYNGDKSPCNF